MSTHEKNSCCEGEAGSGKGLTALLIIVATIANIGASYFFSTQVTKRAMEVEYAKVGGEENYKLINKIQLKQIGPFLEQQKKQNPDLLKDDAGDATDIKAAGDQQPAEQPAEPAKPTATKSDRPVVDLYIMSYCPFGLQAQKPFALIMDKFKDVADLNVRFVPYIMHGLKEAQENARQACIRDEQGDKYSAYARCFVKEEGKGPECLKEAKIDTKKLDKCYAALMEKEGGNAKFENAAQGQFPPFLIDEVGAKAAGVQGSPTLVINGTQVDAARTQDGYAKAICNAFTDGKKPAVCDEKFSTDSYPAMFGMTASANSGAPAAGCGQ